MVLKTPLLFGEPAAAFATLPFEDFWKLYPKKVHRPNAATMWGRLSLDEQRAAMAALPNHVALWQRERREMSTIPNPASWLNPKLGRRWEDEIPTNGNGTRHNLTGEGHGRYDRFVRGRDPQAGQGEA